MLFSQKYSNPFSPKENSKKKVNNIVLGSQYLGKKLEVDLVFYSGRGTWCQLWCPLCFLIFGDDFSALCTLITRGHILSITGACLLHCSLDCCDPPSTSWILALPNLLPATPQCSLVLCFVLILQSISTSLATAAVLSQFCIIRIHLQKRQGVACKNLKKTRLGSVPCLQVLVFQTHVQTLTINSNKEEQYFHYRRRYILL